MEHTFFHKIRWPQWPLVAASAALLASGCGSTTTKPTSTSPDGQAVVLDGGTAGPDTGQPAPDLPPGTPGGLPTMDKAAPTVTRTATFALG